MYQDKERMPSWMASNQNLDRSMDYDFLQQYAVVCSTHRLKLETYTNHTQIAASFPEVEVVLDLTLECEEWSHD